MTAIFRLLLVSVVVLSGCSTEHASEPANRLIGNYRSTAFDVAGPNDAPVDVQAAGGSLRMTLRMDNSFSATVIIPQGVRTVIGSGTTNTYSGVFSLANDSLGIDPSSFIVGGMKWDEASSTLTAISPPRGGIHFILKKQ
jgi:hypothetical protein